VTQLSKYPTVKFGVPNLNLKFVGREAELAEIQRNYENPSTKCLVVSGLGGEGKTELVKKFIHQNPVPSPSFITWLNGDNFQQLSTSIQKLAQFLKLPVNDASGKPLQIRELIQQISIHVKVCLQIC
jgi:AAA+ ATPase superfamily predicted ATPase